MKKTIIAAAVAASFVAPVAMADVSISGMVNPEFSANNSSTGWTSSTNTDLVFKGSEDMGNGMKASFKYHTFHDDGADAVADTSVSLSGDFGTVTAGRFETFNMAYFHPKADMDPAHDQTLEDTMGQQGRGNGVAYVSPSMNGLSVGLSAVIAAGSADANATESEDADVTEIMAKYSNAGLEVSAGQTTHKGVSADEKITNVYVGYTMGDLKLGVLNRDVQNDGGRLIAANDNKSTTFNVAYSMGANTVSVGYLNSDDNRDGDTVIGLKHAMSKRTSVYVSRKDVDAGNDQTLVGIKHTF